MTVIFEKMAMLVFFLASGYLFGRFKIVGPEFNKGLSKLVMTFFLPGMILSSVINKELEMSGADLLISLGLWFIMIAVSVAVGWLTPRIFGMKNSDKGMYSLMIGFMNNGFMGLPLVAAVYGTGTLFFASLSNIPFNLVIYTLGLIILNSGRAEQKLNLKRLLNAPIIAALTAVLILVLQLRLPVFVEDIAGYLSTATAPLSMMCVGLSLSGIPIGRAFSHPKLYLVSLMRLVACPLLTWLILRGFVTDPVTLGTVVLVSSMPSAVVCNILCLENGRDGVESSELVLLSTVLSMATIPLIMSIL